LVRLPEPAVRELAQPGPYRLCERHRDKRRRHREADHVALCAVRALSQANDDDHVTGEDEHREPADHDDRAQRLRRSATGESQPTAHHADQQTQAGQRDRTAGVRRPPDEQVQLCAGAQEG